MIQKFVKAHSRKSKSADDERSEMPILEFPFAERSYIVRRELGAGAYAPVYLAESVDSQQSYSSDSDSNPYDSARYPFEAVKVENGPSSAWEFYMIRTAHERLLNAPQHTRALDSVVRAHELHVHPRESFLVEDYRGQGTLLDLVNILRNDSIGSTYPSDGGLDECLAMFFSIELFRIIEALHATGILHGDIKADNCLVRLDESTPTDPPTKSLSLLDLGDSTTDPRDTPAYAPSGAFGWRAKGLALIDFGRAIDMNAFAPNVQFLADWETESHECTEIREARPWTHQIDLYGIAGVIHVLLFGKYIESAPIRTSEGGAGVNVNARTCRIRESLKRYWDREIWTDVFDLLLNPGAERWVSMEGGELDGDSGGFGNGPVLPVLKSMAFVRGRMEGWLLGNAEKKGLALQLRRIEAVLAERKKKLERV
jgi:checkpoint serine/threonine-protein kinase